MALEQSDYETLATFRAEIRRFLRFSEAAASAVGVPTQQHQALLAIKGAGTQVVSMAMLAEALQIRHHSAVGLVDRMVGQGLVVRSVGTDDRRTVLLVLTAQGEAILEALSLVHRAELHRLAPLLRTLLDQLTENGFPH